MQIHNIINHKKLFLILAGLVFVLAAIQPVYAAMIEKPLPVTIDELIQHLGFDKSHKSNLINGKILSTAMPEMEQLREELAVAAVMLIVRAPIEKVVAAYLEGESFRQNSDILEYRLIQGDEKGSVPAKNAFEPIGYSAKETTEVKKLLEFKGGSTFNLSHDEISRLQAIDSKDPAIRDKVSAVFQNMLIERYESYLSKGLEAVKPYDRGRGKRSSPRRELTVATGSIHLLEKHFPEFYGSLLTYPQNLPDNNRHEFYWFKNKMDNRPIFHLSHYMGEIRGHYGIMAELQFYVGHTYNSMLTVIGCVQYKDGTVVFCMNRTFTDQVIGFGSSLKRSIGRRRIEDTIADHFRKLRTVLESKTN